MGVLAFSDTSGTECAPLESVLGIAPQDYDREMVTSGSGQERANAPDLMLALLKRRSPQDGDMRFPRPCAREDHVSDLSASFVSH